jgi:hypothetical protein
MISVKRRGKEASVRLHWMFLDAGGEVIREIADFIKRSRGKTPLISSFIRINRGLLKEKPPKNTPLSPQGRHYDLRRMFDSLNDEYFGGRLASGIGWGRRTSLYAARKRTLGSYCSRTDTIRINPILDRRSVPGYFVRFVVYHEMLHSDMKEEKKNGRRSLHGADFRRREKLFEHYEKAISWEKK